MGSVGSVKVNYCHIYEQPLAFEDELSISLFQ